MMLSAEAALLASALGLYVYDSALLLQRNEGVLTPRGKRGWAVGFGTGHLAVVGREIYLPNPLLPHRPIYRLMWQFEGEGDASLPWQPPGSGAFGPLPPLVWAMAVALFVLLPLGLFTRLGDPLLMAALAVLFASIVAALVWLWARRSSLQLSTRRFAALAFESLVCPPFALNLIRHVGLNMPVAEDLVGAARRLQDNEDWERTRVRLAARVADELECEEPDSERYRRLLERRSSLTGGSSECR